MRKKVLVVEDDLTMQLLLSTILRRHGIDCAVVKDGKSAVEQWERDRYEIILMDVQMPIMDGLAATRIIREKESTGKDHTLIIGTTAFATDRDRDNCLSAGMDAYVTKPLNLEELLRLIDAEGSIR